MNDTEYDIQEIQKSLEAEQFLIEKENKYVNNFFPLVWAITVAPVYTLLYSKFLESFLTASIVALFVLIFICILLKKQLKYLTTKELLIKDCLIIVDKIIFEKTVVTRLSRDEQNFCDAYLDRYDFNGVEAAKMVGWSDATAYEVATLYLLKPLCQKYINNKLDKRRIRP